MFVSGTQRTQKRPPDHLDCSYRKNERRYRQWGVCIFYHTDIDGGRWERGAIG